MTKPSDLIPNKPEPVEKTPQREEVHMSVQCLLCNSQYTKVYATKEFGYFEVDCGTCGRTARFNLGWEPGV